MVFKEFTEGPLLYSVLITLSVCLLLRAANIIKAHIRESAEQTGKIKFIASSILKACAPAHRLVAKKPVAAGSWLLFHAGIILTPLWFAGHVMHGEESMILLNHGFLSYEWSNRFTLLILFILLLFFFRRITNRELRQESTRRDYLLTPVIALPFLTGYLLANPKFITMTEDTLWGLHIISSAVVFSGTAFLFVVTQVNKKKCISCAACAENCPTRALHSYDSTAPTQERNLRYSHPQCINCGNCVATCPEEAITLKHKISFTHLLRLSQKQIIHSENLCACEVCGSHFIPQSQYNKIKNIISKPMLIICPTCKRRQTIRHFAPAGHVTNDSKSPFSAGGH